jgi:DNA modification methylase
MVKGSVENGGELTNKLNTIICGSNVDVLKTLPDNCIDLVVTSPPY